MSSVLAAGSSKSESPAYNELQALRASRQVATANAVNTVGYAEQSGYDGKVGKKASVPTKAIVERSTITEQAAGYSSDGEGISGVGIAGIGTGVVVGGALVVAIAVSSPPGWVALGVIAGIALVAWLLFGLYSLYQAIKDGIKEGFGSISV